ncbi:glycosyltransferase [Legionella gresilensis]|uniref:glycosyltransferase n=1 Tax=Legionella gresilensis TaxID=91823 RepID=UPI00104193C5|nr:glycosyltransferase [Legionella gresilensis]
MFFSSKLMSKFYPGPVKRFFLMKYFVKKNLATKEYDFIQAMDVFSLDAAVSFKNQIQKPLIVDINELPDLNGRPATAKLHSFFKNLLNRKIKSLVGKVDSYITTCTSLSEFTKSFLGCDASEIKNANSIWQKKSNRNRIQEDLKFSNDAFILIFPATAAPNYGVEDSIHALKKLPGYIKLIFIGRFNTPEYKKKIQALVKKENLSRRVFFKGPYYGNEYFEYLSSGHLGLAPLSFHIKNHNYILPSRLLDMITTEIPMISTNIKEFYKLNSTAAIGIGLDYLNSFQIAKAIKNYIALTEYEKKSIKTNILKLKELLIKDKEQEKYLKIINKMVDLKYKKIAFICNIGIVNNKRLITFCKTLEEQGASIDVYCIEPPRQELKEELANTNFICLNNQNKFLFLSFLSCLTFLIKDFSSFFGSFLFKHFKNIIQYYKKFIPKTFVNAKKQLLITRKFARKIKKIKDYNPDIILLHDTLASKAGIELYKKNPSAQLVMDVTEIPDLKERGNLALRNLPQPINKKFINWEKKFIQKSKLIFTLNSSFKIFMENRYQRDDIEIVKNVRIHTSNKRKSLNLTLNLSSSDIVVVFAGSSSVITCALPTISAFKRLPSNVHLLFLGEATNKIFQQKMLAHVKKLNLVNRVHFHAPIYGRDYLETLAACDIGLVLFKTDTLQTKLVLPNRYLDFVAVGLPVISSDIIDVKDYIIKYNTGEYLKTITPDTIATGIRNIIQQFKIEGNGERCSEFKIRAEALKNHVSEQNDFEVFATKIRQLVEHINSPKVAFLARQRLSSNTRIARQCLALKEGGFDVKLYGINEGPSIELLKQMGNIKVEVFDIA